MMAKSKEERRADKAAYMRRQRAEYPEKYRARSRAFLDQNRERLCVERNARYVNNKPASRAARHGTTKEAIAALREGQNGLCPVCDKPLGDWPSTAVHLDHCHDTGEVRGLLCRSCNQKEGWVRKFGARLGAYLAAPPARILLGIA